LIVQNVVTKEITTLEKRSWCILRHRSFTCCRSHSQVGDVEDKVKLDSNNYVIVGQHVNKTGGQPGYKSMTSVKGLFAAGDVMDPNLLSVKLPWQSENGTIAEYECSQVSLYTLKINNLHSDPFSFNYSPMSEHIKFTFFFFILLFFLTKR